MKRLISVLALSAVAALASGCQFSSAEARDAGPAVDQHFAVGAFDQIVVAGPYNVKVTTGGQPGVQAHGGQAVLAETEVVVEGGKLIIRPKKKHGIRWTWGKDNQVTMLVSAATIRGATIAGSGGIDIDRASGGDFEGSVAGSGDLALGSIEATSAKFEIAGSGGIRAAGKVAKLDVSIAGSGDVDLSALTATDASVSIAGSGNVRTRATGTADISMMGSGNVEVTGGAKCDVSKHGSGDVRCS